MVPIPRLFQIFRFQNFFFGLLLEIEPSRKVVEEHLDSLIRELVKFWEHGDLSEVQSRDLGAYVRDVVV